MSKITNTCKAPRGINIRGNDDAHGQVLIMPGQTVDVEVFDPANPVYKAWQDTGDVDFGGALRPPPSPEDRKAQDDAKPKK